MNITLRKVLFFFALSLIPSVVLAQTERNQFDLSYYLPDIQYDSSIPTPAEILGHEVGQWHVSHDKLVYYMRALAEASDRITIKQTGVTYEDRPLLLLTITSTENHANLENIRKQHLSLTDAKASSKLNTSEMPAVLYQGFSIHGNESSGSNAALLTAYYLAAGQSQEVKDILNKTIILFDPSYNPDGLNRFASWANRYKSDVLMADPQNIEQNEVWPRGRTNHYGFDMNRDWLYVQLRESQARLKSFYMWRPNVLTDHHEMGSNSTFFFQPGHPMRVHPLTPAKNQKLTSDLAKFHASILDEDQQLYYTKDRFDDFYYGKGSTMPDINGSVGILFEQASARSHAIETQHGVLPFEQTVRNQFLTTLSTLRGVNQHRKELLDYQRQFFLDADKQAKRSGRKAYIIGDDRDPARLAEMVRILNTHQIKVYKPTGNQNISGRTYSPVQSIVVPHNQQQHRILKAIFDKRSTYKDSIFYDVSTFTLPDLLNLPYKTASVSRMGDLISDASMIGHSTENPSSSYAYIISPTDYYAPWALYKLLSNDIKVKVAQQPFSHKGKEYPYGTLLIPIGIQQINDVKIEKLIGEITAKGIMVEGIETGDTKGVSLGGNSFSTVNKPSIAMVVGDGVNSYDPGEMWFLLDQRQRIPITMIKKSMMSRVQLNRYNVLILPKGNYNGMNVDVVKTWLKADKNTLIAFGSANQWLIKNKLTHVKMVVSKSHDAKNIGYAGIGSWTGGQVTGGALVQTKIDVSHPLCYGLTRSYLPVFKRGNMVFEPAEVSYENPIMVSKKSLLSGYISEENQAKFSEKSLLQVSKIGRGQVISFTDNPNFRAFTWGTQKLFYNSLFYGPHISKASMVK